MANYQKTVNSNVEVCETYEYSPAPKNMGIECPACEKGRSVVTRGICTVCNGTGRVVPTAVWLYAVNSNRAAAHVIISYKKFSNQEINAL